MRSRIPIRNDASWRRLDYAGSPEDFEQADSL
jgi:hypothetical protein